ncbi:MAG: cyclic nucleotide-binding domain-containing protein [Devosia sp.]|nr:cyclic nucleotide-binding domain-containing protein [Devosia sp.]
MIIVKLEGWSVRADELANVRGLQLFRDMDDARFADLMRAAFLQTFPPHVQLIQEGDRPDFLFIVTEGCAELFAAWNDHEVTMMMVEPGGTFILAAVLKDAVHLMSARTAVRSRILMIPAEAVRDAFERDDAFSRSIVLELADCFRGVVKAHKDLKLRSGVERLAARLLQYDNEHGATGRFSLPHDKRTLAALLGMTPENLSRAFATLRPYGVETDGPDVVLSSVTDLQRLAKPNPLIDDKAM